jgi:hypothetical protein
MLLFTRFLSADFTQCPYCRDHVAGKESLLADGGDYDSSSLREKEATWTVVTNKFRVEKKVCCREVDMV